MLYNLASKNGVETLQFWDDSHDLMSVNNSLPEFEEVLSLVRNDDVRAFDVARPASAIESVFKEVTERVIILNGEVLFDGDPVDRVLSSHLLRALELGRHEALVPIAKFWENLAANPSENSKSQLFNWLKTHDFSITADGHIIAYKGMNVVSEGVWESAWASQISGVPSAYVNNRPLPALSKVRARAGDVVSMPRREVVEDPGEACERGLHVGDFGYASHYGNGNDGMLKVLVNPRDVVSVPNDDARKVRVCRYVVVEPVRESFNVAVDNSLNDDYGFDDVVEEDAAWTHYYKGY